MMPPGDAIAAVTHADPYPFYADLVARRPLYRDEALGLWVASSAEAVTAVLTSELGRVRPAAEPVPAALVGSPGADIFRRLIRMNDGSGHCPFNRAVSATLAAIDAPRVAREADARAGGLADAMDLAGRRDRLSGFAFELPVHVIGGLLGIPAESLPRIAAWMSDFARCIAPGGRPDQIERGKAAAGDLLGLFRALAADRRQRPADDLLTALINEARRVGGDDLDVIAANGIGFLSQAYEATAGLIGNTLIALARHRNAHDEVRKDPARLPDLVQEVLRCDPPAQNTRRFLAGSGTVAGQAMREGDAVLVVLAAANRDPSVNREPARFDLSRRDRRIFTFGAGVHACPGAGLAATIATAGVQRLLRSGLDPGQLTDGLSYRPSANTRIPVWSAPAARS